MLSVIRLDKRPVMFLIALLLSYFGKWIVYHDYSVIHTFRYRLGRWLGFVYVANNMFLLINLAIKGSFVASTPVSLIADVASVLWT